MKMGFEPRRRITYRDHNYKTETREFLVAPSESRVYTLRSLREQRFARLCECLIMTRSVLKWWYEPHQFKCGTIYRKERVYTPDFLLKLGDDDIFDTGTRSVWVEVKAKLDQKACSRQRWFFKAYPDLPILLMVDREYAHGQKSKTAVAQKILIRKVKPYVDRILYGTQWYPKFGIK